MPSAAATAESVIVLSSSAMAATPSIASTTYPKASSGALEHLPRAERRAGDAHHAGGRRVAQEQSPST